MTKWDEIYCELLETILAEGHRVTNRTGNDTIKIPIASFVLDLEKEFPILTTKQLFIRQAILEMLWIYQQQSNDVRWLQERGVHIWDLWEINEEGDWVSDQSGEVLKHFDPSFAHTIGTAYGYIVKKMGLMDKLLNSLKTDVNDRRRVMSLWQDEYLDTAVLPSCVWSSEWDVTDGYLNIWVHQRSCDVPLGLPFNVTQYAVLLMMVAQVTGLKPGKLAWSIKDAHIYVNQLDGVKEQIERYHQGNDFKAPTFWLNPEVKDFYAFKWEDCHLEGYAHMGKIAFPLSQ